MAPHEEAAIGQRCIIREACARSQPPSVRQRRPPPHLRHGIRALPLPPAGFTGKNFCKSGLPQNHIPKPRQIKDLLLGEDLKGSKNIAKLFSYLRMNARHNKHQHIDFIIIFIFYVEVATINQDLGESDEGWDYF
ncbi:hypothetical protein [Aeromonas salmonicida]|uniref:hypothetical protein n=1 Tax=Aeromonas salmonicida TaxID=645 RepID=UPI0012F817C7|nr:hypothetical protein [Aeromonas salmonicida]